MVDLHRLRDPRFIKAAALTTAILAVSIGVGITVAGRGNPENMSTPTATGGPGGMDEIGAKDVSLTDGGSGKVSGGDAKTTTHYLANVVSEEGSAGDSEEGDHLDTLGESPDLSSSGGGVDNADSIRYSGLNLYSDYNGDGLGPDTTLRGGYSSGSGSSSGDSWDDDGWGWDDDGWTSGDSWDGSSKGSKCGPSGSSHSGKTGKSGGGKTGKSGGDDSSGKTGKSGGGSGGSSSSSSTSTSPSSGKSGKSGGGAKTGKSGGRRTNLRRNLNGWSADWSPPIIWVKPSSSSSSSSKDYDDDDCDTSKGSGISKSSKGSKSSKSKSDKSSTMESWSASSLSAESWSASSWSAESLPSHTHHSSRSSSTSSSDKWSSPDWTKHPTKHPTEHPTKRPVATIVETTPPANIPTKDPITGNPSPNPSTSPTTPSPTKCEDRKWYYNGVYCLNDNGDSGIYNSDQECSDANCSTEEGRCPVYNVCWTENPSKSPTTNSPTGRRSRPQTPCAITTLDPTFLLRFGNK